jgi:hypothetical protein
MLLEKVPFPVPLLVCGSVIVGLCAIPQHTPLTVMSLPLSSVIFPPDSAVVEVTNVTAEVVSVAKETGVDVNDTSFP